MSLIIAIVLAVIGGGILYEDSLSNRPSGALQFFGCLFLASAIVVTGFR